MDNVVASNKSQRLFRKLCRRPNRQKGQQDTNGEAHGGIHIILVGDTLTYRHLASTQVSQIDIPIEIGSAHGHCTALLGSSAFGVDVSPTMIEEARQLHPDCKFIEGDLFSKDLAWLDSRTNVVFLDIGGNRNYKPVAKAIAICISRLPDLRLVVVKSCDMKKLLMRSSHAVHVVAHDLVYPETNDDDVGQELAHEIWHRGGEVPLSQLKSYRRLKFIVGKGKPRLLAFLKAQAPLLEFEEIQTGDPHFRLRVRTPAPCTIELPAPKELPDLEAELAAKITKELHEGQDFSIHSVCLRLRLGLIKRYVAAAPQRHLYEQASDQSLESEAVEPWSERWQYSVALRHLHAFISSRSEFIVEHNESDEALPMQELCKVRVRCNANAGQLKSEVHNDGQADGSRSDDDQTIFLQVLDANWNQTEGEVVEAPDVYVEAAWLLKGAHVVQDAMQDKQEPAQPVED